MSTQSSPQDPGQAAGQTASLHYGDGEFAVLSAGVFVRCAVSGAALASGPRPIQSAAAKANAGPGEYLAAAGR